MPNNGTYLSYINSTVDEFGERYFVPGNANCIVRSNIKENKSKVVTWLEVDNQLTNNYLNVCKWKSTLLCIPLHADKFAVVNEETGENMYYEIPQKEESRMNYSFFNDIYQRDNYIYSIGLSYDGFVKFDCDSLEFTKVDKWLKPLKEYITEEKDFLFRRQKHIFHDKLYVAGNEFKGVFIYDFANDDYEVNSLNAIQGNICGLLPKEDFWWIITEENILYKYDFLKQGITETISIKRDYDMGLSPQYQYMFEYKNNIVMYSEKGKLLHWIDLTDGENYSINKISELFPKNVGPYISRYDSNTLLFSNGDCNYMYKFNMKDKSFEKYTIELNSNKDDIRKHIDETRSDILNEKMWPFETFIEYIKG